MGLNYGSGSSGSRSSSGGGCCPRCTCVKSQMAALVTLFLSMSVSFILLILAGTAPNGSWIPMINIIAVVFVPMFVLIADTITGPPTVLPDCACLQSNGAWAQPRLSRPLLQGPLPPPPTFHVPPPSRPHRRQ